MSRLIGEQIPHIKVERWSDECRERGPDEPAYVLPADVRYGIQRSDDCGNAAECRRVARLLRQLWKKYAANAAILNALNALPFQNNW